MVLTTVKPRNAPAGAGYDAYEYTVHSHTFLSDDIPSAKVTFDLSPIQVRSNPTMLGGKRVYRSHVLYHLYLMHPDLMHTTLPHQNQPLYNVPSLSCTYVHTVHVCARVRCESMHELWWLVCATRHHSPHQQVVSEQAYRFMD